MTLLVALLLALAPEGVREAPPAPQQERKAPQLTKAPALLEAVPAVYPPDKLLAGITADVGTLIDIDATGKVALVIIDQSAGEEFDRAAFDALQQFKFSPAEIDGAPAAVRIRYVYHFVLEKKADAAAAREEDPDAGSVRGEVREAGTRNPLIGVEVFVKGIAGLPTAVTDKDGRFLIEKVPAGKVRLGASLGGYDEGMARVTLEKRGNAEVTFYLRKAEVGELSATVTGEKPREAPTRRSLSQAELRNVPGSLNDPIRAIQNLPGLARAPFLSGALLVRGSPPADTGIYLDGDKIPLLFHFLGGPSILPEQMLERIDFYPGGYGSYYGRNLTGAIDVASRGGEGVGLHGQASIDLLQAQAFVETPLGERTRGSFSLRRSYIDALLPLFLPNDPKNGTTSVVPVYYDYQARIDHRLESGDQLSLLAFGSDDNLALVQTGPKLAQPISFDSHIGFHRLHASWKHALGSDLQLVLAPAGGIASTSFSTSGTGQGAFGGPQSGHVDDLALGLRGELRWAPRSWLSVRGGVDHLYDRAKIVLDVVSLQQLASVATGIPESVHLEQTTPYQQYGEYAEAEVKLGRLQLVPGLRLDQIHWSHHTRASIDPRLWSRLELTDADALKAYAGLYHQPPAAQQALPTIGNPDLGLQSAAQVGLGWERRFSELWSGTLDLFYNRKWGLVRPVKAQALADGTVQNLLYDNVGRGRAFGLELMVRREITAKVYGWLSYTLSKAQVIQPEKAWQDFTFDQPHIFTLVMGWRPSVGWELSTRVRYTSGNPTSAVLYSSFNADEGKYDPERGDIGTARSPAFFQLDGRAQYTWTWDLFKLTLYLDVQNLTNRKNEEFHVWDYRYREQGSISGLPILPTLGLQGTW
jgi:TonB family protein